MRVERIRQYKNWKKLVQAVEEIIPSDSFVLKDIKRFADGSYKAFVEDDEYYYEVWFAIDGELGYRLFDFIWEEKNEGFQKR